MTIDVMVSPLHSTSVANPWDVIRCYMRIPETLVVKYMGPRRYLQGLDDALSYLRDNNLEDNMTECDDRTVAVLVRLSTRA